MRHSYLRQTKGNQSKLKKLEVDKNDAFYTNAALKMLHGDNENNDGMLSKEELFHFYKGKTQVCKENDPPA